MSCVILKQSTERLRNYIQIIPSGPDWYRMRACRTCSLERWFCEGGGKKNPERRPRRPRCWSSPLIGVAGMSDRSSKFKPCCYLLSRLSASCTGSTNR